MISCRHCLSPIDQAEIDFQQSRKSKTVWCDDCDGATHLDDTADPIYQLIKEEGKNRAAVIENTPRKKSFKRQLSPLRYPGGKSKLVDDFYNRLDPVKTDCLVSPYAGGASVELAMLERGVVKHIVLNDLDWDLYNFWQIALNEPDSLIALMKEPLTLETYQAAHTLIVNGELKHVDLTKAEKAFYYLINNRCSFSGIYNGGMQGGKDGKRFTERYNPENLIKRIKNIHKLRDKITLLNEDAISIIEEYAYCDKTTFLIDPPYIEKGQDLYRLSYEDINQHQELFTCLKSLNHSFPAADFIIYYDNSKAFGQLSNLPTDQIIINRGYSIAV